MIGPELQKENEMPEFNIRGVINDIDNLLTDGQEMKFEDLTKGKERHDARPSTCNLRSSTTACVHGRT